MIKLVILLVVGASQLEIAALHVGVSYRKDGNQRTRHSLAEQSTTSSPPALDPASGVPITALEKDEQHCVKSLAQHILVAIAEITSYANLEEEVEGTDEKEERSTSPSHPLSSPRPSLEIRKRSESETHVGGCVAKKTWISLGSNHYPRFLKSYNCTSQNCNFGTCQGKIYMVNVLRRTTPENTPLVDEECDGDQYLPSELRCDWKLVPVPVTTYCECKSQQMSAFGR